MIYLMWLREYATRHAVDVLAYCLMTNHVHLVLVPGAKDSLQFALRSLHVRYAQRVNRAQDWQGHVWQGRYFSSALDDAYFWSAMRYVERNPVRAGIVGRAEDYPWSSARAHCGLGADRVLSVKTRWQHQIEGVGDWAGWLAAGDEPTSLQALRKHTNKGLPCGSDHFVEALEASTGRHLHCRGRGRPWAKGNGEALE